MQSHYLQSLECNSLENNGRGDMCSDVADSDDPYAPGVAEKYGLIDTSGKIM